MKPVVHYTKAFTKPLIGKSVILERTLDHPNHLEGHSVSNTRPVRTSTVVAVREKEFETLNTIYREQATA